MLWWGGWQGLGLLVIAQVDDISHCFSRLSVYAMSQNPDSRDIAQQRGTSEDGLGAVSGGFGQLVGG